MDLSADILEKSLTLQNYDGKSNIRYHQEHQHWCVAMKYDCKYNDMWNITTK